jgi:hypothetical protein
MPNNEIQLGIAYNGPNHDFLKVSEIKFETNNTHNLVEPVEKLYPVDAGTPTEKILTLSSRLDLTVELDFESSKPNQEIDQDDAHYSKSKHADQSGVPLEEHSHISWPPNGPEDNGFIQEFVYDFNSKVKRKRSADSSQYHEKRFNLENDHDSQVPSKSNKSPNMGRQIIVRISHFACLYSKEMKEFLGIVYKHRL